MDDDVVCVVCGRLTYEQECSDCDGSGEMNGRPCESCSGTGELWLCPVCDRG